MEKTFKITSILLYLLLFTACATTKHTSEKTKDHQRDSIALKSKHYKKIQINQAIEDTVFLSLNTGNTKIDSVITNRLKHFKTTKKSGTNSYAIEYDNNARGFQITSSIGKTKELQELLKDSIVNKQQQTLSKTQQTTQIKYRIPMWLWIAFLVIIGGVYLGAKFKLI